MNAELTENVQSAIRPGAEVDTYYYGETNSELQSYPCIVNNKFVQAFTNQGPGTSQFTISPYQGISDVVLYFKLPDVNGGTTNCMLPQSWGYSMIEQVSVRYGSSAQYFFTGEQLFLASMQDCEDSAKRDQLAALGGSAYTSSDLNTGSTNQPEAYVYLKLPHNSPRADGKPLPFPSDLLVQPITLTIQLKRWNNIAANGGIFIPVDASPTPAVSVGQGLATAEMQVKQEMMSDSADLLARRVDMNSHAYTFPLMYFPQNEVQIQVANSAAVQSVNLTGFRAGEVTKILLWLTKKASSGSINSPSYVPGTDDNGNLAWAPISDVTLTYNGEIFFRAASRASNIWNLICDSKEPGVNGLVNDSTGGFSDYLYTYVDIPFAQVSVPYDKEIKLVHGKPILNAVVNLQFKTPSAADDYTLHAMYLYNASLLCSRGSAEYVF